ncbi:MAG: hypothetical protein AAF908_02120 [Pseudomonadota bacterium]
MRLVIAAALVLAATSAQAAVIYEADFSQAVSIDHTNTGNAIEASPQRGANFTIGYPSLPDSDTTRNFLETDGTSLISSDFGGAHFFFTDLIDVSGFATVTIDIVNAFVGVDAFNNSPTEFIRYSYVLDGGPAEEFFFFTNDPNGPDLNATEVLDVAGVSNLLIRIDANVNGAGDGWQLSSLTVDATVPLPATLPLMLLGALALGALRARRA